MKRLIRKADEISYTDPNNTGYVSGIVFNDGWDAIENDEIADKTYISDINREFKFEELIDSPSGKALFNDF